MSRLNFLACIALFCGGFAPGALGRPIDSGQAATVAANWATLIVHERGHWGGSRSPIVVRVDSITRAERVLAYYCVLEPSGFVLVSRYPSLAPVKAYATRTRFAPADSPDFEDELADRLQRVIGAAESVVGDLEKAGQGRVAAALDVDHSRAWEELLRDPAEFVERLQTKSLRTDYSGGEVLLETEWDQGYPYNDQCPSPECGTVCGVPYNTVVGCVALAGAQVMRYWYWPPYGEDPPFDVWYDYVNMPHELLVTLLPGSPPQCQFPPQDEIDAVAQLCRMVGLAVDTDYGCDGSGAYFASVPGPDLLDAFEDHFWYSTNADDRSRSSAGSATAWFGWIRTELDANRPVPYRIPGHVTVADGWQEITIGDVVTQQYHINWGHGSSAQHQPGQFKNYWYTVDAIPGSDPDEEQLLVNVYPACAQGIQVAGGHNVGYHYVDRNCLSSASASFSPGVFLHFLTGARLTANFGHTITLQGTAADTTYLYTRGDISRGIHLHGGTMAMQMGGSVCIEPLAPPQYLHGEWLTNGCAELTWEDGRGDEAGFEVQYKFESGSWAFHQIVTERYVTHCGLQIGDHYWRVRAWRPDGTTSGYSEIVKLVGP